jgi:hypothetical protein
MLLSSSGCLDLFFSQSPAQTPNIEMPKLNVTSTPLTIAAKILRIDFDKERYSAGDQVKPSLIVLNTGTENITTERVIVKATCIKLFDFWANLLLQTKSEEERSRTWIFDYTEAISPKETKKLYAIFNTQAETSGIRLAGEYNIVVTLKVNGRYADSKSLKIALY